MPAVRVARHDSDVSVRPLNRETGHRVRPGPAWRSLGLLCALFTAALVATGTRYGYHRDELYFVAIGGHPAFGYADQPPLVPLLAHGIDAVSGHSLAWLRVPSALAGAAVVLVTGLIAREFGGARSAQLLAAACVAVSGLVLGASHLLSTTTFDLLGWTATLWLVVRALRDGGPSWLLAGLAAGLDLQVKTLPVFLLFALLVGVLAAGPRTVFTSRWLWAGSLVALALWAPNLAWQATHGWPQLHLAGSIASGGSGSSQPRALFVPFQFLLMGPMLAPIWIAGLWRLARRRDLAPWACLPVAYLVLVVVFVATGGKPYYLAGLYPVLFAAGAPAAVRWAAHSATRLRILALVLIVNGAVSAIVALPVVPARLLQDTPIVAVNYDAGEQVGWPQFARTVADVHSALPAPVRSHAIVLTSNYGEAGAVLRYAPALHAAVYSGHNAFWNLGPPPLDTTTAVAVGFDESDLHRWFGSVRRVATIDNGVRLHNDEQGEAVWLCARPAGDWTGLWRQMRHLG